MAKTPSIQEKKKLKRENILKAAIDEFSDNGFAETTIAAIAKRAGVSFGTVFTYFESKELLYQHAVLEPLEEFKTYFCDIEHHFKRETPEETIRTMVSEHVQFFAVREKYLRLLQQVLGRPERFPELFEELNNFAHNFVESITPIIEEGQKSHTFYRVLPEYIAISYFSLLNGMRLTYKDDPEHQLWESLVIQGVRLFMPAEK